MKERKFWIEKLPFLKLLALLFGIIGYGIHAAAAAITGELILFLFGPQGPQHVLFLMIFFSLSFIAIQYLTFGIRQIKEDSKKFLVDYDENFFQKFETATFSKVPIGLSVLAVLGMAIYRVFILYPLYVYWIENNISPLPGYIRGFPFFVVGGVFWAISYALWLQILWLVFRSILLILQISSKPMKIIPLEPDRVGGLKQFGYFGLRIALGVSVSGFMVPAWYAVAIGVWGSIFLGVFLTLGYMVIVLLSFFAPFYTIHKRMVSEKRNKLEIIGKEYLKEEKRYINRLGIEEADLTDLKGAISIIALVSMFGEAEKMKEWPFDMQMIRVLINLAIAPFLGYIVKLAMTFIF